MLQVRIKIHLMIEYVVGHDVYVYSFGDNMYKGANTSVECLFRTLKKMETVLLFFECCFMLRLLFFECCFLCCI